MSIAVSATPMPLFKALNQSDLAYTTKYNKGNCDGT